jgi:hypothetical protein
VADPDLVHRAEQAYLGAVIARQGRIGTGATVAGDAGPDGFASLRPQDFTDPVHQAIYAAVAGQAAPRPRVLAGLYERLRGLLSRLLHPRARDASAYMAGLPDRCPDPANLPAYAAMVAEASEQRGAPVPAPAPALGPEPAPGPRPAGAENPRLASAGEWLEGAGQRRRPAGSRRAVPAADAPASRADRTAGDLAPDVARLARALRADARSATRGATGTARTPLPPESQPAPLDAEALQEQVLADLMRRPADGRDVISWLPDTVFTAGPHRSLYQLISIRLADGRPVDPLIIAWDASMLGGPAGTAGIPETAAGESLAAAALRLGALDSGPGTAAILGRTLYAEHVCTDSFGPGWPEQLSRIPAPASAPTPAVPAHPSRRPEPGPSEAGQAVASATDRPGPSAAPAAAAASRAGTAPDAARDPMPALPRRVSSPPLQQPPAPGPAGPAPARRM